MIIVNETKKCAVLYTGHNKPCYGVVWSGSSLQCGKSEKTSIAGITILIKHWEQDKDNLQEVCEE